jgi:hypothetical protein
MKVARKWPESRMKGGVMKAGVMGRDKAPHAGRANRRRGGGTGRGFSPGTSIEGGQQGASAHAFPLAKSGRSR